MIFSENNQAEEHQSQPFLNTNGEEVLQNQHQSKKSFLLCSCFCNQKSTESTNIAVKCESNQASHVWKV